MQKKNQIYKEVDNEAQSNTSFMSLDKAGNLVWKEDKTFQFHFKLFCLIPLGIHTIYVVRFQQSTYEIYTNETNTNVYTHRQKNWLKLL